MMSSAWTCISFLALLLIGLVDSTQRAVDLTHTLKEGVPYFPTLEKFRLNITHKGDRGGYWYQDESISGSTHMATHLDSPCHFFKDSWCVTDIPLDHLIAPAVLVDIRSKVGDNADYAMTSGDLEEWEKEHGRIPDGSVLLILTGWGRFWSEPSKFLGSTEFNQKSDNIRLHFPGVSGEAAHWLAENRNIVGLGTDALSIDPGNQSAAGFAAHTTLAAKNVFNLENLAKLEELPATGIMLYTMPLKIEGTSGAPARVVAILGSPQHQGSSSGAAPLTLLTTFMMML